jgi:hypothetical protein
MPCGMPRFLASIVINLSTASPTISSMTISPSLPAANWALRAVIGQAQFRR